eukprot:20859-Eustigmatos_ZCMA.PRE.1
MALIGCLLLAVRVWGSSTTRPPPRSSWWTKKPMSRDPGGGGGGGGGGEDGLQVGGRQGDTSFLAVVQHMAVGNVEAMRQ